MVFSGRQWVGLVHPSAELSREALARHIWFVTTRLAFGAIALAAVPLLLAANGSIGFTCSVAVVLLAAQAIFAVVCSRTGRLDEPYRASALGLALLAGFLAASTDGFGTPVLGLLPILIVEGALIGGRRDFLTAATLGTVVPLVLIFAVALDLPGLRGGDWAGVDFAIQQGVLVAMALGLGTLALREVRVRQNRERQLAVQGEILARGFGDLVTRHDMQGGVLSVGPSAGEVLGVAPESLLGRGLFDHVHVADRPTFLKAVSDAAAGKRLTKAVVRMRCAAAIDTDAADERCGPRPASPRFGWFDLRIQLVQLGDEADEIVCVLRDITEQRRHEDELELARSQAVSANEMKSGFLATVSHELRTPLNAIIGFSEMLSSDKLTPSDDERRRDYARIIHLSGQHLLDIVNTLLDVSRIDAGTLQLDPEPFAIESVVAGTIEMMKLKAEQGGLALRSIVEPGLPPMLADKRAVKQILLNLLSNGVKFTPAGGSVTVRVVRDGDAIRLIVEDTGIGIRAEDLPRLGEPFFQAQSTYARKYEGTGLGLSVVKGLVGLHGGAVSVESHAGRGTTVTVRLSLHTPARPATAAVVPIPLQEPSPGTSGGAPVNDSRAVKRRA
jgi:cell cycle sensor histidine kinase DivJ